MKKLCGLIAIVCMLVCIPCAVNAAIIDSGECGADGDNITWTLDDEGTLIISGTGDIADYAFCNNTDVISVIIGNGVTSIGESAFYGGEKLTNVIISDSVISIGDHAFNYCLRLASVTIGNKVTTIGDHAFYCCYSLTNVTIPDSVTSIGESAFLVCGNLWKIDVSENNQNYSSDDGILFNKNKTDLILYPAMKLDTHYTIPDSVTNIGDYAFGGCADTGGFSQSFGFWGWQGCSNLMSITIPDSVTNIGERAFGGCNSLTEINVSGDNQNYSSDNGILFNKNKTALILYPVMKMGTQYNILDSVISIGDYAFDSCISLESVTIGNNVTSIGSSAFRFCESLASITIPDSVKSIDYATFQFCESLTSITIPDSVTSIGGDAFLGCDSLNDIYYNGSEAEWAAVNIGEYNEALTSAAIHCNGVAQTSPPISVTVNGAAVAFDQPPIIEEGRTLVPVRAIFEALGATVYWNGDTRTVTATKDNTIIILQIGNNIMQKNGENIILDVPAKIISDRTLVPVRAVAEAFDNTVGWNGDTREVIITD